MSPFLSGLLYMVFPILNWLRRPPAWKKEPLCLTEPEDYGNDEACLCWGNISLLKSRPVLLWEWGDGGTERGHCWRDSGQPRTGATLRGDHDPHLQEDAPEGTAGALGQKWPGRYCPWGRDGPCQNKGWQPAPLRDQSSRKAIKLCIAEDTIQPSHLLCNMLLP